MNEPLYIRHQLYLPSGRVLEIVYTNDHVHSIDLVYPDTTPTPPNTDAGIHICPECGNVMVIHTDSRPISDELWEVELACVNCSWQCVGVFDTAVIEHFMRESTAGQQQIQSALEQLEQQHMHDDIEDFIRHLQSGHIGPHDFH